MASLDIDPAETSELDLLTALLEERDIEFAAEGKRWYDLLRLGRNKTSNTEASLSTW